MSLTNCKECGKEVSKKAEKCPHCGAPLKPKKHGCGTIILLGFLVVVAIAIFSPDSGNNYTTPTPTPTPTPTSKQQSAPAAPPLELISWRCVKEHSYIFVRGEVRNVSSSKLENIMAVGEFRTKDGTLVKTEDALLEYNPLLPGQTSPFSAGGTDQPAITSCNISFKHIFGRGIAYYSKQSEKRKRIAEVQRLLTELGYDAGGADGVMGPKTKSAIQKFQRDNRASANGQVSDALLVKLREKRNSQ